MLACMDRRPDLLFDVSADARAIELMFPEPRCEEAQAEPESTEPASDEGYDLEPSMIFHSIPKATEPVLPTANRAAHPQSTSTAIVEALKLRRLRLE
jgi:hypothetical protein